MNELSSTSSSWHGCSLLSISIPQIQYLLFCSRFASSRNDRNRRNKQKETRGVRRDKEWSKVRGFVWKNLFWLLRWRLQTGSALAKHPCVYACLHARTYRSAAAKQRLLYIKAGLRLCPEVSVISLCKVTHTCTPSTNTHADTQVHEHMQTQSSEVSVITTSQSKERLSSSSKHTATLHLSLNPVTSTRERYRERAGVCACLCVWLSTLITSAFKYDL